MGRPTVSLLSGLLSDQKPALAPLSLKDTSRFHSLAFEAPHIPQSWCHPHNSPPLPAAHLLPPSETPLTTPRLHGIHQLDPEQPPPSSPTRCTQKPNARVRVHRGATALAVLYCRRRPGAHLGELSPRSAWPTFTALSPCLQPSGQVLTLTSHPHPHPPTPSSDCPYPWRGT